MSGVLNGIMDKYRMSTNVRHLIICLLVDGSLSMAEEKKMETVLKGINEFLDGLKNEPLAKNSTDICIISYSGTKAKIVQDFVKSDYIDFKGIVPDGGTPFKEGLELAIDTIFKRRKEIEDMGAEQWVPWLIILGDGKADSPIDTQASMIQDLYRNHKLKGKCVGVGSGCETSDLVKVAPHGHVEKMDVLKITELFQFLSRETIKQSISKPNFPNAEESSEVGY